MKRADLDDFKAWFSGYCASFRMPDAEDQRNLRLKEEHTARVCATILRICRGQSFDDTLTMLAEAAALFHDVGRFPQYAQYRTFRDSISVNHGELGARTLEEQGVLRRLPRREQERIVTAVKFHNVFKAPPLEDEEQTLLIQLVRDADKLDIWRVFTEYYEAQETDRASAAGLGLPDLPGYSREALSLIFKEQLISLAMLKTQNDFRLAQMAWVFDLNFATSFKMVEESGSLKRIGAFLPETAEVKEALAFLLDYTRRKASGGE